MSALAAVFLRDGATVEAARLAKVQDALRPFGQGSAEWRRGPAGLVCRNKGPDAPTSLADCRLAQTADGSIVLFNGFLHAPDQLATAVKADARASRRTDADLFAKAWELWNDEAAEKVPGHFAAAVWEPRRSRLVASCSERFPPPLYYAVDHDSAVVATAPAAVLAWTGRPRRLDDEHLAACMIGDLSDVSGSCWQAVRSLPPGHQLTVTPSVDRVRRWYVLEALDSDGPRLPDSAAYVEATATLLRQVVGNAMRAPETPAIMLSGGLDSTAIAATALDLLKETPDAKPLLSVTMRPVAEWNQEALPHVLTDEGPLVQAFATMHRSLDTRFADPAGATWDWMLERVFELTEAPPVRWSGHAWRSRCMQVARHAGRRVLLDGGFGNATLSFDGGGRLAELTRAGRVFRAWKEAHRSPRTLLGQAVLPLLPAPLLPPSRRSPPLHLHWKRTAVRHSAIHPSFADSLRVAEAAQDRYPATLAKSRREVQIRMLAGFGHQGCELRSKVLAMSIITGVEQRSPLSDRRIVEWCTRLPSVQYVENGRTRLLAKRLLQARVPGEILSAPRGRQNVDWHLRLTPHIPAIREELREWRRDPSVAERLDVGRLLRLVGSWPNWTSLARGDHPEWRLAEKLTEVMAVGRFIRWAEGS